MFGDCGSSLLSSCRTLRFPLFCPWRVFRSSDDWARLIVSRPRRSPGLPFFFDCSVPSFPPLVLMFFFFCSSQRKDCPFFFLIATPPETGRSQADCGSASVSELFSQTAFCRGRSNICSLPLRAFRRDWFGPPLLNIFSRSSDHVSTCL